MATVRRMEWQDVRIETERQVRLFLYLGER